MGREGCDVWGGRDVMCGEGGMVTHNNYVRTYVFT